MRSDRIWQRYLAPLAGCVVLILVAAPTARAQHHPPPPPPPSPHHHDRTGPQPPNPHHPPTPPPPDPHHSPPPPPPPSHHGSIQGGTPWYAGLGDASDNSSVAAGAEQVVPGGGVAAPTAASAPRGRVVASGAQQAVLALLTARGEEKGSQWLVGELTPASNASAGTQARILAKRVSGLLLDRGRLPAAVAAYNAFVDASSSAFLSHPPDAFLALQAALADASRATAAP